MARVLIYVTVTTNPVGEGGGTAACRIAPTVAFTLSRPFNENVTA